MSAPRWDLTALLNAADPSAPAAERHLWLVRLMEWLREPGPEAPPGPAPAPSAPDGAATAVAAEGGAEAGAPLAPVVPGPGTPWPVRRLRHLLNVLERHPAHELRVASLLRQTLGGLDASGLLADFGFAPRQGLLSELGERLRLSALPGTPETEDLGELFHLLFTDEADADWIQAIDEPTLGRVARLCGAAPGEPAPWAAAVVESIQLLASQLRANGLSGAMRRRMDRSLLADRPFHQVVSAAEALREQHLDNGATTPPLQQALYLRAVLSRCREAASSVRSHLDEHGISVDVVFQVDQIQHRAERIEALLVCLVSPRPLPELRLLVAQLVQAGSERRGVRPLLARHYALLARKVTERSAETGEHYITRDRAEYAQMLRQAAGGGLVIGFTTLMKFAIGALALSAFWAGFWAGMNYAVSFVVVHLLHWTVATKQPAMTAPAMAAKLEHVAGDDHALEGFVDEVTHLIRSQMAGILGNLALVIPVVLVAQGLGWWLAGAPLVGEKDAHYVLHSLTLLGPTALFAAFTGVLLFGSSLIAGWVENWFVYHRLSSAIAWNPWIRRRLGPTRAERWALWWRQNISGLAANISLGLLLGVVPAVGAFFGLPVEVRHVTLAMGQLAAALGALGPALLHDADFWWCLAAIPAIGLLNLGVSFWLAFRVALASRGLKLRDRGRIHAALRRRLRRAPMSFLLPPAPPRADHPNP